MRDDFHRERLSASTRQVSHALIEHRGFTTVADQIPTMTTEAHFDQSPARNTQCKMLEHFGTHRQDETVLGGGKPMHDHSLEHCEEGETISPRVWDLRTHDVSVFHLIPIALSETDGIMPTAGPPSLSVLRYVPDHLLRLVTI